LFDVTPNVNSDFFVVLVLSLSIFETAPPKESPADEKEPPPLPLVPLPPPKLKPPGPMDELVTADDASIELAFGA
jgi:hypothetical protein